jgi:hypothetical protein
MDDIMSKVNTASDKIKDFLDWHYDERGDRIRIIDPIVEVPRTLQEFLAMDDAQTWRLIDQWHRDDGDTVWYKGVDDEWRFEMGVDQDEFWPAWALKKLQLAISAEALAEAKT